MFPSWLLQPLPIHPFFQKPVSLCTGIFRQDYLKFHYSSIAVWHLQSFAQHFFFFFSFSWGCYPSILNSHENHFFSLGASCMGLTWGISANLFPSISVTGCWTPPLHPGWWWWASQPHTLHRDGHTAAWWWGDGMERVSQVRGAVIWIKNASARDSHPKFPRWKHCPLQWVGG